MTPESHFSLPDGLSARDGTSARLFGSAEVPPCPLEKSAVSGVIFLAGFRVGPRGRVGWAVRGSSRRTRSACWRGDNRLAGRGGVSRRRPRMVHRRAGPGRGAARRPAGLCPLPGPGRVLGLRPRDRGGLGMLGRCVAYPAHPGRGTPNGGLSETSRARAGQRAASGGPAARGRPSRDD